MKNNALIIAALVGIIVGAVVAYFAFGPVKPPADIGPAKFVVMFGDPNSSTMVTANLTALQNALASPAPNWSTLQEVVSQGASPTPVPIPSPVQAPGGTVLISRVQVIQKLGADNSPCTMHVTQKVGLSDPTQVSNVIAALNPNAPYPR